MHSYLPARQVRGSIPLIWTQIPSMKYKPVTHILAEKESGQAFEAHFRWGA